MLTIFDFDDTLFRTDAKLYIRDNVTNTIIDTFTTSDIAKNKKILNYYKKNGCKFDYSEMGGNYNLTKKILYKSRIIRINCDKIKELYYHNKPIAILTSRSVDPKLLQDIIKSYLKIIIPLNHIISVNNDKVYKKIQNKNKIFRNKNRKKEGLYYFIKMGYKNIKLIDDDIDNIKVANELNNDLKKIGVNISIKAIKF